MFFKKYKHGFVTEVEKLYNDEFKSKLSIILYDKPSKKMITLNSVNSYQTDYIVGDCVKYDEKEKIAFNNNRNWEKKMDQLNKLIILYRKERTSNDIKIPEDDKMLVSDFRFKHIMDQEMSNESMEGITFSQSYDINVLITDFEEGKI